MIVSFKKVNADSSVGNFVGNKIEIKRTISDQWVICLNGKRTNSGPFVSREAGIRHVQKIAEKILLKASQTVTAQQKPLSPLPSPQRSDKGSVKKRASHPERDRDARSMKDETNSSSSSGETL